MIKRSKSHIKKHQTGSRLLGDPDNFHDFEGHQDLLRKVVTMLTFNVDC